jgi:integrase
VKRAKIKLTKKAVDALVPGGGDEVVWDAAMPGFGLRINPGGRWSWVVQYRNAKGISRRLTLGVYRKGERGEAVLTPDEARAEARWKLREAELGNDPADARQEAKTALTVKELCQQYLADAEHGLILGRGGRPKKISTLATDRGRVDRHIVPLLGRKLVKSVNSADIKTFMKDVTTGATAMEAKTGNLRGKSVVKGGHGTARRTAGLLGGIFSYAVEHGHITVNPVRGVKRGADGHRRFRLAAEQYRQLGEALAEAEQKGEHWQAPAIVRLLALTGCRRAEIVKLQKTEVDLEGRCLRFIDTKTGPALKPLGEAAALVLAGALARQNGSPFVFPGVRNKKAAFGDLPNAWDRIVGKAFTPHGLRHAFASACDDLKMGELTIAALLGHEAAQHGSVTRGYVHKVDAVLLQEADRIGRHIDACMRGASGEGGAVEHEQDAVAA